MLFLLKKKVREGKKEERLRSFTIAQQRILQFCSFFLLKIEWYFCKTKHPYIETKKERKKERSHTDTCTPASIFFWSTPLFFYLLFLSLSLFSCFRKYKPEQALSVALACKKSSFALFFFLSWLLFFPVSSTIRLLLESTTTTTITTQRHIKNEGATRTVKNIVEQQHP